MICLDSPPERHALKPYILLGRHNRVQSINLLYLPHMVKQFNDRWYASGSPNRLVCVENNNVDFRVGDTFTCTS